MIKTIKADGSEKEFLAGMKKRSSEVNAEVEKTVRAIIDDVAARGDEAVKEYTARFDCPDMQYYRVPDEVIQDALTNADPDFVNSMLNAQENITAFHTRQKQNGYMMTDESGCILGQRVRGLDRVGLYVPGGTAAYPSSVLMNAIPAKIAGVGEIIMVTPPMKDGTPNNDILVAAALCGVDKIFMCGGAQAVAALAFGTEEIPKVSKIVGPGNIFVATAKKLLYGTVDIDMIAGPSEILIVADEQKPFRREVMRTYGANVTPSPSMETEVGKKINAEFPGTTGSLGCAISEAVECATTHEGYRYVLGSVLSQVLLHQTVIGLETKTACEKYGIKPDMIIGCAGGGSNLGGLISPFMGEKLRGEADYEFIAVEPASCPSLTRGVYAYDFCDTGAVCPLAKMYTLGSTFIPSANHAGGLRYHGMSSVLSQLYHDGYITARSVEQTSVFAAAEQFARTEGILPAPESSHAIRVAIDEAMKCKETGEEKTILFGLTGTGYFDMVAYQKFNDHEMSDYIPTDEELKVSMDRMPKVD